MNGYSGQERRKQVDLNKIYDKLNDLSGDMKEVKSLVHRHDKTLYGNGQPGICNRVNA